MGISRLGLRCRKNLLNRRKAWGVCRLVQLTRHPPLLANKEGGEFDYKWNMIDHNPKYMECATKNMCYLFKETDVLGNNCSESEMLLFFRFCQFINLCFSTFIGGFDTVLVYRARNIVNRKLSGYRVRNVFVLHFLLIPKLNNSQISR